MRRIDNSLKSESFGDGYVWVYPLDAKTGGMIEGEGLRLSFGERNISYKRVIEARQADIEYSRIICVPIISPGRYGKMRAAVIGGRVYRIETVQEIHTAVPPCAVLGLSDRNAGIKP